MQVKNSLSNSWNSSLVLSLSALKSGSKGNYYEVDGMTPCCGLEENRGNNYCDFLAVL